MILAAPSSAALFPSSPFSSKAIGSTGAAFLKVPSGAREEAMGGVAAATTEGSEAVFWNPAGLARLGDPGRSDLSVGYNALLNTTYSGSGAYARSLSMGTIAGSLLYFSQSPQTAYSATGDAAGQFTPYDAAASVGYAAKLSGILVGGAVKVIRSVLPGASGSTAAVDLGAQAVHVADAGDGAVDVGGSIQNLGPAIKVGSTAAPLPFSARGGMLWHASPIVSAGLDVVLPVDQDPYVEVGFEAAFQQPGWKAALRAGFDQSGTRGVDGLSGMTAGAGLDLGRLRIDYAWVPFGDLGQTNRITLAFRF